MMVVFRIKKVQLKSLNVNSRVNLVKTVKNIPYEQGDNDFYLFHLNNRTQIYLLSEKVMIDNHIITPDSFGRKSIQFYPNKNHQFLYNLDNSIDIQKIIQIFSIEC